MRSRLSGRITVRTFALAAAGILVAAACGLQRTPVPVTPRPSEGPTPTPAPTAAGPGITVPAAIDASGATDVSPALNAWIAAQPDGSTLVFPPGSRYLLEGDAGLQLVGRSALTLEGTGSTLLLRTTGESNRSSAFFLQDSTGIVVRGFAVDGGNPATGTPAAEAEIDEQHNGVAIRSGSRLIAFEAVTWDNLRGFGVFIGADGGTTWPEDIAIRDCTIRGGEMGVAIVAGRRIDIIGNRIDDSVYFAIDLEPDVSQPGPAGEPGHGGGFIDVRILDNDVTRYGWGRELVSYFVAFAPADEVVATAVMDGLTISGNRVHEGEAAPNGRSDDGLGGLGIRSDKANVKRDISIIDNWTADDDTRRAGSAVISLTNVENLVVTGNRQPITGRSAFLRDEATGGTRTVERNDTAP